MTDSALLPGTIKAEMTECLIWYDGPQLIRCVTEDGTQILAAAIDNDFVYLAARISRELLPAIADGTVLRTAFTVHRIGNLLTGKFNPDGTTLTFIEMALDPPEEWLPLE